jgi:hypothetical protein
VCACACVHACVCVCVCVCAVAHAAPKLVMLHLVLKVEDELTRDLPEIVRRYDLQACVRVCV